MYRTHTCGELRESDIGKEVTLAGWVQSRRNLGSLVFIDLRDRYGITQLVVDDDSESELKKESEELGREFVISAKGEVRERSSKNPNRPTGDIEVALAEIEIISKSEVPPFTIEEDTDGGEELRMKYRYLDLRRENIKENLIFRHKVTLEVRKYLSGEGFLEIETPVLIKSTPEGARDFVVPSRMHPGEFYALPQSPQTFKQLLMVAGMDKYFQIVRCFRDEDLRADRQPEFTQIDCEMSFVHQEDILKLFEGMTRALFKELLDVDTGDFPVMQYDDAMTFYGTDKPDLRFDMQIRELTSLAQNRDFNVFNNAEYIGAIKVEGSAGKYSNKDLKKLTDWVCRPQVGAKGLVYVRWMEDDSFKSNIGKFYEREDYLLWMQHCGGQKGDTLFILSGDRNETLRHLGILRLELGQREGMINESIYAPLWVTDFPLLEWDHETQRYYAMHHPFTSPKAEYLNDEDVAIDSIKADAYDLVINGVEIGGGSVRIHDPELQQRNFEMLGFTEKEAREQFGFLLDAFKYGAPPHGGIAFGLDRFCAVLKGRTSIRDFIAFPKNNQGRDVMIDSPSKIDGEQVKELGLGLKS